MQHRVQMTAAIWPERWQLEAIEATEPFVNTGYLVEIAVGDPATAMDGSLIAGYMFTAETGDVQIVHDRSG